MATEVKTGNAEHVVPPDSELAEIAGFTDGTEGHELPFSSTDGTKECSRNFGSTDGTELPGGPFRSTDETTLLAEYRTDEEVSRSYGFQPFDPEPGDCSITDMIRFVIRFDRTSSADLSRDTGIPKATLSRFLNRQGNLSSDKLNTLADHLGLTMVRRVKLSEHVERILAAEGQDYWWRECSGRMGNDWDELFGDTDACQQWELEFRKQIADKERERLQAITWIVLDDDMPTEPAASQAVKS